ncbi:hypothetical protein K435DRAFT_817263 [Dendrothele bispora CBS 962.96]|uniref:CxC2-like cysteine cluster KDZ transposase-associated domain-containing protein n=1 Tax=Dendrothele bispora (strain CBS 962.96) TaxID=1314807 RepID=A0A4S8MKV6_DENBC|nr:hypothetical protein K435DRAFT_817263 [Dendrothele bispora CBS 962.96]
MQAHLFPGSTAEPISAFSFSVLKEYDLHTLQAKFGAYDYCFSLRRLTDNVFTHLVNDPYQTFMRVARFWRYMDSRIRMGQEHGISRFFPHRPNGFLMLYCPACSDPGVNMLGEWWRTPWFLRHLISKRVTFDGNHQANQFWKNTDPFDKSLADGLAYFPETTKYLAFLKSLGHISPEEFAAHCNHVKVIANQGRIQGQNCVKTGVVNTQCDHVFVMATADMQNGERYANVDASAHHAFAMYGFGDDKTDNHRDLVFCADSYDANCSCCVNKTAEYYWVELNQVGGYTRQMNNGHREDTIISHHNDWNWRKTVNLGGSFFVYLFKKH